MPRSLDEALLDAGHLLDEAAGKADDHALYITRKGGREAAAGKSMGVEWWGSRHGAMMAVLPRSTIAMLFELSRGQADVDGAVAALERPAPGAFWYIVHEGAVIRFHVANKA